jgi:hypothetical protein
MYLGPGIGTSDVRIEESQLSDSFAHPTERSTPLKRRFTLTLSTGRCSLGGRPQAVAQALRR